MNVRKFLNQNPILVGAIAIVVAGAALWFGYSKSFASGNVATARYFTTDDGKTFFEGGAFDFAPFMKDGKEAVRAYVFECDGKAFVGYLERFNKQSRPAMDELEIANREKRPPRNLSAIIAANRTGTEIKRPGDREWIPGIPGPRADAIRQIKCDDGKPAIPKNR